VRIDQACRLVVHPRRRPRALIAKKKLRVLSYHTLLIAVQKECRHEFHILRGISALTFVLISVSQNVELLNFQPNGTLH
jgi:hypothetical protein